MADNRSDLNQSRRPRGPHEHRQRHGQRLPTSQKRQGQVQNVHDQLRQEVHAVQLRPRKLACHCRGWLQRLPVTPSGHNLFR